MAHPHVCRSSAPIASRAGANLPFCIFHFTKKKKSRCVCLLKLWLQSLGSGQGRVLSRQQTGQTWGPPAVVRLATSAPRSLTCEPLLDALGWKQQSSLKEEFLSEHPVPGSLFLPLPQQAPAPHRVSRSSLRVAGGTQSVPLPHSGALPACPILIVHYRKTVGLLIKEKERRKSDLICLGGWQQRESVCRKSSGILEPRAWLSVWALR